MRRFGFSQPAGSGEGFFSFVGSAAGDDPSIEISAISPGLFQAGDFCVIFNFAQGTNNPGLVTPSGFIVHQNNAVTAGSAAARGALSSKILVGDETTVTGMDGSGRDRWICAVWRPAAPISARAWTGNGQATSDNPASQTIAAAGKTLPLLLVGQTAAVASSFGTRTISPAMIALTSPHSGHLADWFQYGGSDTPVNHGYDMGDEGLYNVLQSGVFEFTLA